MSTTDDHPDEASRPPRSATPKTVVTISRQLGCGGAEVGQLVAARLGFHYADREILHLAAEALDMQDEELAWRDERPSTFWDKIAAAFSVGPPETPYIPPPVRIITNKDVWILERRMICELTQREDCVIVGRAGVCILRDHPGATHVMLYAPDRFRIQRVMELYKAPTPQAALDMMRDSDAARQTYHARLGNHDWLRAENYHLAIDTSAIPIDQVADLIVRYVRVRARFLCGASQG